MKNKLKKIIITIGFMSIATTVILLSSCNSIAENDKTTKANEDFETLSGAREDSLQVQNESIEKYEDFKKEVERKIDNNEKAIDTLKTEVKNKSNKAKVILDKSIATLEQKNVLLKEKIRDYNEDGTDKWKAFKIEFNRDMDSLEKTLKDLTKNNSGIMIN